MTPQGKRAVLALAAASAIFSAAALIGWLAMMFLQQPGG